MLPSTPSPGTGTNWVAAVYEDKQRRKLVVAVMLLLAAITAILVRDYRSSLANQTVDADSEQTAYAPSTAGPPPVLPATPAEASASAGQAAEPASTVLSSRSPNNRVLARRSAKSANSQATGSTFAKSSAAWGQAQVAAGHEGKSAQAPVGQPSPSYPLLTQATAVQGSVLMQALIAADGKVEEMRVISGPAILVSAARQAVQQWRFQPYLQNGKPVETYARVTVNFTIDVSNTEARYHVNSVISSGAL